MSDWWKNPLLQGEDNDYGQYDYLIEELPKDHANWDLQWYTSKCDSCGKESHYLFRSTHYFYCWDGWDSLTYTECWRCMLKDKIYSIKNRIKRKFKILKTMIELRQISPKWGWKKCYDCAKKFN